MNWIKKHKLLLGILLALLFLSLALRKVSISDLQAVFVDTSVSTIIWVILLNLVARIVIAARWLFLLPPEGYKFNHAFHYMNIGYFINSIFPARSGDAVKAMLLAKKKSSNITYSLSSVILERLFDLAGLGLAFIIALGILNLPVYLKKGGFILLFSSIGLFILFFITSVHSKVFYNWLSGLSKHKAYIWIIRKLEMFLEYSRVLKNNKIFILSFIATAISWFLYVFSGYIIIEDISPTPFSWHVSLLALLLVSVSFVLPTTPGNLGIYQFACVLAFAIADMPKEPAIVFSLVSQVPVYLLNVLLGLFSMAHEGVTKRRIDIESSEITGDKTNEEN